MTLRPVLGALAVIVTLAAATPALAHHGYAGPVRLYLETVRLETTGPDWHIRAGVNDAGTGKPAPGFVVEAVGSGPQGATFGPVHLADVDADGRYDAALGALPAGDWSVTVNVTDGPNSEERAIPVTRTWNVAVQPNESPELTGRRTTLDTEAGPSSSGGSSSNLAASLALAGVVALFALSFARHSRRHHPAVPTR